MDFSVFENYCAEIGVEIRKNEPMCKHTSFKTGGMADIFLNVGSVDVLTDILETAKALNVPTYVIGKGSNLLVSDDGIEGAVITLSSLDEITVDGENIIAGAGASLSAVCVAAANAGLTGLEFAYGIPGSVGGALYMNAGAYDGEMSYVVVSSESITLDGKLEETSVKDMKLGYRTSVFKANKNIITKVVFALKKAESKDVWDKMNVFMERRKEKQPLEYPSAGSTFKRPTGYFAGALIEENDLKGVAVGGAMVSEKHAGFIINYNNATTDDILKLIKKVQKKVFENNGIELETEVIFVGRE